MSLNIPNHIAQTEIALGTSTLKGRAIPALVAHTLAQRAGTQVVTLQNACFVPGVGLLRDGGLPECYVPANAWTTGPANELLALMGGETFNAKNIAPVISERKAVNGKARELFGSDWWGETGNTPMKLARQEAALREMMRVAAPAPVAEVAPVAAPVHDNGLDALIAAMNTSMVEPPAPVAAPETNGLPGVFADILAGAEKAPVAQATEAQPVATKTRAQMADEVMSVTGMSKSSAGRLPEHVLKNILNL